MGNETGFAEPPSTSAETGFATGFANAPHFSQFSGTDSARATAAWGNISTGIGQLPQAHSGG
jgi:hypothetical protein